MALSNWRRNAWETILEHGRSAQARKKYLQAEMSYTLALVLARHSAVGPRDMARLHVLRGELFLDMLDFRKAEYSFKDAILLYEQNNLGSEIEIAIALRYMSMTLRIQGKLRLAAQMSTLAHQYTAQIRVKLEKCFEIPAS